MRNVTRSHFMSDDLTIELPSQLPVMVLPGAPLFPYALLPLYIFEPRYRAMLADCLAGPRMFCVAMMKPGISEARRSSDFYQIAGCGLVRACVGKEDGTSNLILQGLARVRFSGFAQEKPYRVAEVELVESIEGDSVEAEALAVKVVELCQTFQGRGLVLPESLEKFLAELTDPNRLADLIGVTLIRDPFARQRLLEEPNVSDRLRLLIKLLDREVS